MPQARPKRVPSTSLTTLGLASRPDVSALADGTLQDERSPRRRSRQRGDEHARRSSRRVKGLAAPRQQDRKKIRAPRPSAIAGYWKPRAKAKATCVSGPARVGDQGLERSEGAARRRRRRRSRRRRVAVGRDDAVGRHVGAVAQAGLQPDREPRAAAARMDGSPVSTALASASKTRSAPKAASTGSSKRRTTWRGRGRRAWAPRLGMVAWSCACAGSRRARAASAQPRRARERRAPPLHHASPGSLRSSGAPGRLSSPREPRRRRTMKTAIKSTMTRGEGDERAHGRARPSRRSQISVPPDLAGLPGDLQRHVPGERSSSRLDLSVTCGGTALGHPVHAGGRGIRSGRCARRDLPLRRRRRIGRGGRERAGRRCSAPG